MQLYPHWYTYTAADFPFLNEQENVKYLPNVNLGANAYIFGISFPFHFLCRWSSYLLGFEFCSMWIIDCRTSQGFKAKMIVVFARGDQ